MGDTDRRHGDPAAGGLTSGEKAAISRAVHEGTEIKFLDKHPELTAAANEYRKEVEAKLRAERKGPSSPRGGGGGGGEEHHLARGELSAGQKAAVARAVHAGKDVTELPFVQGHKFKTERALEYAEEASQRAMDKPQFTVLHHCCQQPPLPHGGLLPPLVHVMRKEGEED